MLPPRRCTAIFPWTSIGGCSEGWRALTNGEATKIFSTERNVPVRSIEHKLCRSRSEAHNDKGCNDEFSLFRGIGAVDCSRARVGHAGVAGPKPGPAKPAADREGQHGTDGPAAPRAVLRH